MRIICSREEYTETRRAAVAVGYFDGMHIGHAELIRVMKREAEANGLAAVLLTFDMSALRAGGKGTKDLITRDQKLRLACESGVDYYVELRFDEVRELSPELFSAEILGTPFLNAAVVCSGTDFRFGRNRAGSVRDLEILGTQIGFRSIAVEEVRVDGIAVSTSLIKQKIRDGKITEANRMLGYSYQLEGTVIHGNHLAHGMGFPTANITLPEEIVSPKRGVYLSQTIIGERKYRSITNIGVRPTVTDDVEPTAETHILDFDGDLYGQKILLLLHEFIRPEQRFASAEELVGTVKENIRYARTAQLPD